MVPPQIGNLAWPQLLSLSSFASPLLSIRPGLGTCPFVCPLNLCRGMGVGDGAGVAERPPGRYGVPESSSSLCAFLRLQL